MENDGILIINKPSGWTSHDVVNKTRRLLGGVKVGHTGTLDPFATGVLVLLVGSATRQAKRFEHDVKGYIGEVTFGYATDTYDCTGSVTETGDPSKVDRAALLADIENLRGESYQVPPPYAAVKVGGVRLYKLARQGKAAEAQPRKITIHSITGDIRRFPVVTLEMVCSKGTYVRSIAHELGKKAGCPAHLSALVRTRVGEYSLADAVDFISAARESDVALLARNIRTMQDTEAK